ncbi:hypothetical protein ACFQ0G_03665 [Streptomyces chiangmaiensis]
MSDARALTQSTDAQHAVAAVNGDYFNITETNAAEGPEIQHGTLRKGTSQRSTVATIGADRIARLADLMITGTVAVAARSGPSPHSTPPPCPPTPSRCSPRCGVPVTARSSTTRAPTPNSSS